MAGDGRRARTKSSDEELEGRSDTALCVLSRTARHAACGPLTTCRKLAAWPSSLALLPAPAKHRPGERPISDAIEWTCSSPHSAGCASQRRRLRPSSEHAGTTATRFRTHPRFRAVSSVHDCPSLLAYPILRSCAGLAGQTLTRETGPNTGPMADPACACCIRFGSSRTLEECVVSERWSIFLFL